jgi:hypothetical protein
MKLATVVVLLFASYPGADQRLHAQATFDFPSTSGNAFISVCSVIEKKPETRLDAANIMSCISFVEGVVRGIGLGVKYAEAIAGRKLEHPFCIPEDASKGQLVIVVLKFIRNHQEKASAPSYLPVAESLTAAFPCKE